VSEGRVHYAGELRIVRKNRVTTIFAGGASCKSGMAANAFPLTKVRSAVTCLRCLRNIELHDRSPAPR